MIRDHGDLGLGMLQRMHAKQSREKVFFFQAHDIKTRVLGLVSMAGSINIPDKFSDASSLHSF